MAGFKLNGEWGMGHGAWGDKEQRRIIIDNQFQCPIPNIKLNKILISA